MLFYYIHVHLKHTNKTDDREINLKRYVRYFTLQTRNQYILGIPLNYRNMPHMFSTILYVINYFFKNIGNKKIVLFLFLHTLNQ